MSLSRREAAGVRGVAVAMPATVRRNDYFRQKYPAIVQAAEQKTLARSFAPIDQSAATREFDEEMAPYLQDPFRGTVERRVLAPGETALSLEARAVADVLAAAGLRPRDVDLLICCSFLPDQPGVGNAAFLARETGIQAPGWNLESTCTSALVGLQTASALVRDGQYERVLVVVSCTYSRVADEDDTLSWFMGDGAGAFLVGPEQPGRGILGVRTLSTAETCGAFYYELALTAAGQPRIRMGAGKNTSKLLRETGAAYLRESCREAAAMAGVALSDIALFAVNTPLAWYTRFCARVLEVSPERMVNAYPRYANIGPALPVVNLHHAATQGRLRPGDLVMLYTVGSVGTAGAMVMRWGDVSVGPQVT